MEVLFVKPNLTVDGGEQTVDGRWLPGMAVQLYEDGGIGTPVTSPRCIAVRIPGITLEQGRNYFANRFLDLEEQELGDPQIVDGEEQRQIVKRRRTRISIDKIPAGLLELIQAGQNDFTLSPAQVERVLSRIETNKKFAVASTVHAAVKRSVGAAVKQSAGAVVDVATTDVRDVDWWYIAITLAAAAAAVYYFIGG